MSAPAPEWVSVGYIALTAAEFQDLRRYTLNARGGESLELMLEPEFHAKTFETPMQAMLQQRKERVRKLGGAPSESDKAVKMYLRAAGTKVADAIQSANFVILHLQTKDNIADALSRRELVYQDTGSYTVASWMSPFEELPFKDKSKWMLTVQQCTLVPRLEPWLFADASSAGADALPRASVLGCTFYVAVQPQDAPVDLTLQDTKPLLACLARNTSAAGRENPFQADWSEPLYPLCSSSLTAMSLACFAFKKPKLLLLEMSASQLPQKQAPLEHPVGAFWLLPASLLLEKIHAGEMLLRKAMFEMTQTNTREAEPQSSVLREVQIARLQDQKRKLQGNIEGLHVDIAVQERDLKKVQRQLVELGQVPRSRLVISSAVCSNRQATMATQEGAGPGQWASVGYMALTAADFEGMRRECWEDLMSGRPPFQEKRFVASFVETAMEAMFHQRTERVRQLGGAPSENDKAVKARLQVAGTKVQEAIQSANFVTLHLKTRENMADALSRRDLLCCDDGFYLARPWCSPFEELPFQDNSKWMLTVELLSCTKTCEQCTLLPRLEPWMLADASSAGAAALPSGGVLGCTFYVAIQPQDVPVDLSLQDTKPLLSCLARNTSAGGRKNLFLADWSEPLYPLCSSSLTAMSLACFAFKKPKLLLLEMSASQLLVKQAPLEHPVGAFWLLPASVLIEKIHAGEMLLRKAMFEMTQTVTREAEPQSKLIRAMQVAALQGRKRKLEDSIGGLKAKVDVQQRDLKSVEKQVAALMEGGAGQTGTHARRRAACEQGQGQL
ncbi:Cdkl4 [Symbiodinium natans]|uniref:Cdkl4 protein n=1 Tax=Symbiodinium natans TaxID=878477 RepID=A0A812GCU7_9DINO|nr:Cdkl4 [Symbiodinium natans]